MAPSTAPLARKRLTPKLSSRAGGRNVIPRTACMFLLLARDGSSILAGRSRGEAFRSGEARPLAADWPLRVGPQSLLRLEALTSYHKLPHGPASRRPSRLRALICPPVPEALCRQYLPTSPTGQDVPPPASASASTPPV